jgi:hypothetical protein
MWNLDDNKLYVPFIRIEVPRVFTWGSQDRSKREVVREVASRVFPLTKPAVDVWAFRIFFKRPDKCDVDNVTKVIMDAFCAAQIERDASQYGSVGLYADDSASHVKMVQVAGVQEAGNAITIIEIFGCRNGKSGQVSEVSGGNRNTTSAT